jgi:NAD-dependent deacetylase
MNIVVLTGAGISAESGISTFRDSDGLWENHDIMDVASHAGFLRNPKLVLDFYNARRKQLWEVSPNIAHFALAKLESKHKVTIVTQNVDDLHERAGSNNVIHLHGELRKVRSTKDPKLVQYWTNDLNLGDVCPLDSQLRPHIVWFGEMVPLLDKAAELVSKSDILIIVGTSMQVYPAAGLVSYTQKGVPVYYIDPKPQPNWELKNNKNYTIIAEAATLGVVELVEKLLK